MTLHLSGRIQSNHIDNIQTEMNDGSAHIILDLSEVTLVDGCVVRFLRDCEDQGVRLDQCPLYVREWILRERAETGGSRPSNGRV
jgi:hypothetical protein